MSFDKSMSYNSTHRKTNNFSVTTGKDGSRSFYSDHDNRYNDNNNRSRGTYRSRGGSRGNRGNRGRSAGYRNVNSAHSRFKNRYAELDEEGDDNMGGPAGADSSQPRGRRDRYIRNRTGRRGVSSYRGGQSNQLGGARKHERWFKVSIPFGAAMAKDEMIKLITENIEGQFSPVQYQTVDRRAIFYIEGHESEIALRALSRRITKPDGHKLVLHVAASGAPEGTCDEVGMEKLKVRMSDLYDPSTQVLNLNSFYTDEILGKEKLFFPLNRPTAMQTATKIISEYIPELSGLDLSSNKLLALGHVTALAKATPKLTSLNLRDNQIRTMDELEKVKAWVNLTELVLDGNDLCNHYSNQNTYISAVRKIFPKVTNLDGTILPPPITFDLEEIEGKLPPSVDCYFVNEEIKATLVTFIKEYFTIFDTDKRRDLMAAYHENAQFSICASKNPNLDKQPSIHKHVEESRNLIKIGHYDTDKLVKKTKIGVLGVVSMLELLPQTTHDISSFKVDLTLALPSMISFVLHGFFKEADELRSESRPLVRAFSRSFVIVPCGNGMVIINDMLTITNARPEQTKNMFKPPTQPAPSISSPSPSQPGPAPSISSPTSAAFTPEQIQMVESFSQQSGMNKEFSLRCLQENAWDYQKAGTIFTQLQTDGKIPPDAFIKS